MRNVFADVSALRPGRSMFDLSYDKKFTCDMGQLIPVLAEEVVPGDRLKIGNELVLRFNPMIFPLMHGVDVTVHYFFVPNRLLWSDWEKFITGGADGQDATAIPRWVPSSGDAAIGGLWDYLGFPTTVIPPGLSAPIDLPKRAYNLIWNEYYRDENLQTAVDLVTQNSILYRNWKKDYFTSSLPWQQRGIAPALPISGVSHAVFESGAVANGTLGVSAGASSGANPQIVVNSAQGAANVLAALQRNSVDLSTAATFNVSDLRLAFQIQKWMERNARAGVRYTEFLTGHFGVGPRDERLQRPEYIGGSRQPVIVSEVLQTSRTDSGQTPQGTMAGHGLTAGRGYVGTYHAEEYGIVMGLMSVMPEPAYQQGIDRQWLKRTRYDYYFPEFAHLSEQAVELEEIYAGTVEATNRGIFGYQGRYDELRVKRSMTCGLMRTDLKAWGLTRIFASAPALNSAFVSSADIRKDIFAVPSQPGLIVNFGNLVHALRPLPFASNPGLIDHA